jgi:hypothetical protein
MAPFRAASAASASPGGLACRILAGTLAALPAIAICLLTIGLGRVMFKA